jgi:hypothetical protein
VDSLEYHLGFPQQLLTVHRLIGRDVHMSWTLALAADLPNVFPLLAGLDPAVKILRPLFAVLGALALTSALRMRLNPAAAVGAAWLGVMIPRASVAFFTAKNDAILCGIVLGAMAMALRASARRVPSRALVLAGCACGTALSMKVVIAPIVAAIAGVAVWRMPALRRARTAGVLALWALAPFLPWVVKSWLFTGDPVYPLGVAWAPGWFGDPEAGRQTGEALAQFAGWHGQAAGRAWSLAALAAASGLPMLAALAGLWSSGGTRLRPAVVGAGLGLVLLAMSETFDLESMERFAGPAFAIGNVAACALVLGRGGRTARAALLVLALAAHLRPLDVRLGGAGGAAAGGYLAGRVPAARYRLEAVGSYGRILPAVQAAVRDAQTRAAGGRGHILAVEERLSFGLPVRVIGEGLGPRLPWVAAHESSTARRIGIRFRQAGIRWVLYNSWKADWARLEERPYAWGPRMLVTYDAFVRGHLRLLEFGGRVDAVWGSHWLFEVEARAASARGVASTPVLFLPGAERALSHATRAAVRDDLAGAIRDLRALHRLLPDVAVVDAALGHALTRAGRFDEAYPLVRSSVDAGLVSELNLFDWAVTAGRLGRRAEAAEALRRAAEAYPGWTDLLAYARREAGFR